MTGRTTAEDPRDTAIAAVRAACDRMERRGWTDGAVSAVGLRALLDGAALDGAAPIPTPTPVPPPPAPTRWTAEEQEARVDAATERITPSVRLLVMTGGTTLAQVDESAPGIVYGLATSVLAAADAAVLALRAEEAAAAAPATTDDDRVALALYDDGAWCEACDYDGWDGCEDCRRVCRRYAATAHRAAGSPS